MIYTLTLLALMREQKYQIKKILVVVFFGYEGREKCHQKYIKYYIWLCLTLHDWSLCEVLGIEY